MLPMLMLTLTPLFLASLFILILACYFSCRLFVQLATTYGITDTPNSRSLHHKITPRGGGIIFSSLWVCVVAINQGSINSYNLMQLVLVPASIVTILGFVDDCKSVNIKTRLLFQLLAAIIFISTLENFSYLHIGYTTIYLSKLAIPLAILCILWSINLFNFMDGLDALATLQAIFVLSISTIFFYWYGAADIITYQLTLVALLIGFLLLNKPNAKIFMGDAGSYFLGFIIVAFALIGEIYYGIPIALWLIVHSLFWFDATATLLWRVVSKQQWYAAHNLHAYQRLHNVLGWPKFKILLSALTLNLILAAMAIIAMLHPEYTWSLLAINVVMLNVIYMLIYTKQR